VTLGCGRAHLHSALSLLAMNMEQSVAMNREGAGSCDIPMDMGVFINTFEYALGEQI